MPFVGQHSDIGAPPVLVGGQVAQSVEQRPEKPCVGGSIPSLATFFRLAIIAAIVFAAVGLFGSPVIANDNNGKWLAQTYHAFALAAQGEHLAAAKQLAKIGESRNDPDYFYEAANEAMLAGDSPLAIQYGKRRIALGGGDMARRDYIEILLYGGRWQQAEDEMAALSAEGLLNDTQLFLWLRHYNNTQANAIGAKLFSDNGRDYLARMGIASGNWHLAQIAAVAGMQTNKDNYVLYFLEARAVEGRKGIGAAIEKLDEYIAIGCPGIPAADACAEAPVLLAYQQMANGEDWDAALHRPKELAQQAANAAGSLLEDAKKLTRAKKHFSRFDDLYSILGIARLRMADDSPMEALRIVNAAQVQTGSDFSLRERSAAIIEGLIYGKHKRLQRLAAARQTAPDDYYLLYEHSLVAEENGDIKTAIGLLQQLVALYPNDAQGLNALGYLLADNNMQLAKAQQYIQSALNISRRNNAAAVANATNAFADFRAPVVDDANILDSLGWVYYRRGMLQEAALWLQRAATLSDAAEIAAHYGEVLWQAEKHDQARQIWQKALARDSNNKTLKATINRFHPFQ